jgi:hypothetical protein
MAALTAKAWCRPIKKHLNFPSINAAKYLQKSNQLHLIIDIRKTQPLNFWDQVMTVN